MASAVSPSSSPRLPSPPPIAEDQLGPKSPGVQLIEDHGKLPSSLVDPGAARRIRPGTRAEDMAEGPPLVELQDIDSAFQLTEHLKALHHTHTHPPGLDSTIPISSDIARQLSAPPPNTSKEIWLYELGRFLIQKTNTILVALFADDPPCSSHTCPEMRASEWQYLCAVHDPPKSCSAIDYCCHTLDWAAGTLTSSKMFPSRLGLGSAATGVGASGGDKVLQQQMKEITNIFRRVYRIYAHAWFQHREMFWRVEGKSGLYVLFKTVCDEYGLIQRENYTIPPEAEGDVPDESEEMERLPPSVVAAPALLKREESEEREPGKGDTTKRHPRHTHSTSTVSSVIHEEAEEEEDLGDKPALGRQATALKAFDDEVTVSTTDRPGVTAPAHAKSDIPERADIDPEDDDTAEITVIATEPDEQSETPAANAQASDSKAGLSRQDKATPGGE